MQNQFTKYIAQHCLFTPNQHLLVAVSGGADSVVLLHLLMKCNYKVAVAHCNFNLRGKESDSDEVFVKNICEKYGIESHFIQLDTHDYAKQNKLSIEMAARELRYNWFYELAKKHHYHAIVVGHHLNDSIETLFLNLARGTGYNGVVGISPKNEKVVRPLLFASRKQIESYAQENKLSYCTDSSNLSDKYQRNIIRNQIIPLFERINQSFEQVMQNNMNNLWEAAQVLNHYFNQNKQNAFSGKELPISIPFYKILGKEPVNIHLYHLISEFGFNGDAVKRILKAMKNNPGRIFLSATHRLLIDRDTLIISKHTNEQAQEYELNAIQEFARLPFTIKANTLSAENFQIKTEASSACLDADKIKYPLILRKWKAGDYFYPLGMSKRKKVSDFLIDTKVNRLQKENTWVLESNEEIFWVIGYRVDNRFKIDKTTQNVLLLELLHGNS